MYQEEDPGSYGGKVFCMSIWQGRKKGLPNLGSIQRETGRWTGRGNGNFELLILSRCFGESVRSRGGQLNLPGLADWLQAS